MIPSFAASISNDVVSSLEYNDGAFSTPKSYPFALQAAVRSYTMLPTVPSGIFPKLGAGLELGVVDYPFRRAWQPGYIYYSLYAYLPGFARTHGLRLTLNRTYPFGGKWLKEETGSATLEYALTFAPVDWSFMSPVTYVRNFELHLYASANSTRTTRIPDKTITEDLLEEYVGAGICARLCNFAWMPYGMRIGLQ